MPIRPLNDQLISQIAAGEVVERPASVIKELVENSLDADARAVRIELEQGGLRYMSVSDDGVGIDASEMPLALTRHATSKIDSLATLEAAPRLGFRGEALASIASVAGLKLSSRSLDAEYGACVESSRPDQVLPCALEVGSRCEVFELFGQVPARRKFMKTPATEFRHIQRTFNQLALARFDVGFRLIHDDRSREVLAPAETEASIAERVAGIAGNGFMEHAVVLDERIDGLRLSGWLATPGFSRARADLQYCFVNDRPVRDALISHAIREAYRDLLHGQRYPAFVLYLEIDPGAIDVNAHPAKSEIRFRQSRLVHDFVRRSVGRALAENENRSTNARTTELPVTDRAPPPVEHDGNPSVPSAQQSRDDSVASTPSVSPLASQYRFQMPTAPPAVAESAAAAGGQCSDDDTLGYALAQLHDIYILAENEHGLIVVDMHAAHERVLYEQLKTRHARGQLASSRLLVPASIDLQPGANETVERRQATLAELGFEITPSADQRARITAVPEILADQDYLGLARDLIGQLVTETEDSGAGVDTADRQIRDVIDGLLADMGCKAAIKAGRQLTVPEMNQLLRDMAHTHHAGHCNHGRPSWIQVDRAGLDRLFMRGQ